MDFIRGLFGGKGGEDQPLPPVFAGSSQLLRGHSGNIPGSVMGAAWSPDGKRFASGADKLILWNAADWQPVIISEESIQAWDAVTGERVSGSAGINALAWSPDGRSLAVARTDARLSFIAADTGKERLQMKVGGVPLSSVAWSPDGELVAVGGWDMTVRVYEAARGLSFAELLHESAKTPGSDILGVHVAWSPDGKYLASGGGDQTVRIWDVRQGILLRVLKHKAAVISVAWSPDGRYLASGSFSNENLAHIWDAATGKLVCTLKGHTDHFHSLQWSPDGAYLASGSPDKTVKIWNALQGRLIQTLEHANRVNSVAWSPDGKELACGCGHNLVQIWR